MILIFLYYLKCAFNIIYSKFNLFINIIYKGNGNNSINKYSNESYKLEKINSHLYIVKLYGSYYEMGINYGKCMKHIIQHDITKWINFIKDNEKYYLKKVPKNLIINNNIFDSILNLYNINLLNFNKDILEFMKGISLSTKIEYNKLIICNLLTDIMDNHCILLSKKINNKIFNLRTFDYGGPNMHHTLIIFNPKNKIPYCSLNISWATGLVTGISKEKIFFGESYYDTLIDKISYNGMPFHHISHLILNNDKNINEIENSFSKINRKSNLHLFFSDKDNSKIFLSSKNTFKLDKDLKNNDIIYSMTKNEKKRFNKKYLNSIDNAIKKFIPNMQSGELHTMIYYDNKIYISVTNDIFQSYNNTFYSFNINNLFNK